MYRNAEQRCHRFMQKMGGFLVFHHTPFLIALLYPLYCVCIGNFDTSTYYLPFRIAIPFSIASVFKWYLYYVFIQLATANAYIFCVIPAISYFVCCGFYLDTLCDHFDYLIGLVEAEFDQSTSQDPDDHATAHNRALNARKRLSDTVDHHNKIYE